MSVTQKHTDAVTVGVLEDKMAEFLNQMKSAFANTEESLKNYFGDKINALNEEVRELKHRNED